jgi:hypothetical protein
MGNPAKIADCQLPIESQSPALPAFSIGNWQLAIGNLFHPILLSRPQLRLYCPPWLTTSPPSRRNGSSIG